VRACGVVGARRAEKDRAIRFYEASDRERADQREAGHREQAPRPTVDGVEEPEVTGMSRSETTRERATRVLHARRRTGVPAIPGRLPWELVAASQLAIDAGHDQEEPREHRRHDRDPPEGCELADARYGRAAQEGADDHVQGGRDPRREHRLRRMP
jgi:hypothetical protein